MSAETLRKAAALMRERAEAAPPSPWTTRATTHGDPANGPTHMVVENSLGLISDHDYDKWGGTSAEHIASWHPAVAHAVAGFLEAIAHRQEAGSDLRWPHPEDVEWAGQIARSYLGESA